MLLRVTTQSIQMHLLWLLLCALMAMAAAQSRCDPLTQYEKNGECCNMCGPGTSMTSLGTCKEPQCKDCGERKYQDKYTNQSTCHRQPYCDPNLNFEAPVDDSKKRTICRCKLGFHCSSIEDCSVCTEHTTCKPGYGAQHKGNHMRDTVCEKCPEGTFSNETSWDGVCTKWSECRDGYHIAQSGTGTSDNVCEKTSRTHLMLIGVVSLGILIVVLAAVTFCLWKGKRGDARGKVKKCIEGCLQGQTEPVKLLTVTPTDPDDEESMLNELRSSQEEGLRSPEESDETSLEAPTDIQSRQPECFTENGKYVAQENGTTEKLSRQESQTQTFTG